MPRTDERSLDDERRRLVVAVVGEIARAAGLDPAGAAIVRAGSSTLVELPAEGLLVRVDPPSRPGVARHQVVVARALAARAVPAITLGGPDRQPIGSTIGDLTFWRREVVTGEATPALLGATARRLHDAFRGDVGDLPPIDPFDVARAQLVAALDDARWAGRVQVLLERADVLRERWPALMEEDPLGITLVHGDLHTDNLLVTERGPVLADLELAGVGPASYDLVPALVAVERYGAPASTYAEFIAAYGADLRAWSRAAELAEVYELVVTTWAVANRTVSPAHDAEARLRVARWTDPTPPSAPWQLL